MLDVPIMTADQRTVFCVGTLLRLMTMTRTHTIRLELQPDQCQTTLHGHHLSGSAVEVARFLELEVAPRGPQVADRREEKEEEGATLAAL